MNDRALAPDDSRSLTRLRIRTIFLVFLLTLAAVPLCANWSGHRSSHITGCVLLEESCTPVPGARVGVQGSAVRTETDCSGRFCLTDPTQGPVRIVAWKLGYFIAGTQWRGESRRTGITIRLKKIPAEDSPNYQWVDPNPDPSAEMNCANCHADIYRQWAASSHARSAVNRHFLDVFYGTDWSDRPNVGWNFSRDQPDALAVCSACHLPTVQADDPVAESPARATGITREGIHCDYCHKIADTAIKHGPQFLGLQHGRDALRLVRPAGDQQIFFGPLDDVDRGRDTFSPLYRSSTYCASCHEGTLFGSKVYETFSEWAASPYARRGVECQQCHMKPDGATRNIAPGHGGIDRDPNTLATHHFPGSMNEPFLRSSVELTLTATNTGGPIHATVNVRPVNVGHRLPTGSPDRHLLLIVQATNERGTRLPLRSGPTISSAGGVGPRESGNYAGAAGKLYGKLLAGPGDTVPAPFWLATSLREDTRLLPDRPDHTEFTFAPDGPASSVEIQATLIYRRFYKTVLDEKSWPDRDLILAEKAVVVRTP